MGAPYVSQTTAERAPVRCDGCYGLTPRSGLSHAEGLRLCPSCAMAYATRYDGQTAREAIAGQTARDEAWGRAIAGHATT
jgi:hypothetical protein